MVPCHRLPRVIEARADCTGAQLIPVCATRKTWAQAPGHGIVSPGGKVPESGVPLQRVQAGLIPAYLARHQLRPLCQLNLYCTQHPMKRRSSSVQGEQGRTSQHPMLLLWTGLVVAELLAASLKKDDVSGPPTWFRALFLAAASLHAVAALLHSFQASEIAYWAGAASYAFHMLIFLAYQLGVHPPFQGSQLLHPVWVAADLLPSTLAQVRSSGGQPLVAPEGGSASLTPVLPCRCTFGIPRCHISTELSFHLNALAAQVHALHVLPAPVVLAAAGPYMALVFEGFHLAGVQLHPLLFFAWSAIHAGLAHWVFYQLHGGTVIHLYNAAAAAAASGTGALLAGLENPGASTSGDPSGLNREHGQRTRTQAAVSDAQEDPATTTLLSAARSRLQNLSAIQDGEAGGPQAHAGPSQPHPRTSSQDLDQNEDCLHEQDPMLSPAILRALEAYDGGGWAIPAPFERRTVSG